MQVTATTQIQIGQRIYTNLYARGYGSVVRIHGEQNAASVRSLGGGVMMMMGGAAEFDIVFDGGQQSQRLPECILRGVQWRILPDVVGADKVAAAITKAAIYQADMKAKADEAAAIFKTGMEAVKAAGVAKGLIPEADFRAAGKRGSSAAFNLRAELKQAGIKASVKQDGYNCLRVIITDKADADAAKALGSKYKAGHFDGMTDSYDFDPSAWGKVFGDVQYVFVEAERGRLL